MIERKTINASVKNVETTDDVTRLLVKVTSFGDPETKDLGGDYFLRDCDFGDKKVKRVKAFYDHALNTESNPYAKADQQLIGTAELVKVDDDGRWFEFEIEKANYYHDGILALHEKNMLGASTQAFLGGVDRKDDGGLTRWWESEVSLTVCPMDTKTIGESFLKVKEESETDDRLKALVDDWQKLIKSELENYLDTEGAEGEDADTDEPVESTDQNTDDTEDVLEDELSFDLDAEIDDILANELDSELDAKYVTRKEFQTLLEENRKLHGSISAYVDIWGSIEEAQSIATLLTQLQSGQKQMATALSKTQKAVRKIGAHAAEAASYEVKRTLKDRKQMSKLEREAEFDLFEDEEDANKDRKIAPRSPFPAHAPGGN